MTVLLAFTKDRVFHLEEHTATGIFIHILGHYFHQKAAKIKSVKPQNHWVNFLNLFENVF